MTLEQSILQDIEDCVASRRLHHNTSYHDMSHPEKEAIRSRLLAWYDKEKRTNMPWRKPTVESLDREVFCKTLCVGSSLKADAIVDLEPTSL